MVMVLSKWKVAAALAVLIGACFVGASLVYSQQTTNWEPAGGAKTETVTLSEPGKPPQQYIVLRTYRMADGKLAKELRHATTGAVITVYEQSSAPASEAKTKSANSGPDWVKSQPNGQGVVLAQDRQAVPQASVNVPTPVAASPKDKSTLMSWFASMNASPPQEVQREQTVVAVKSDDLKLKPVPTPMQAPAAPAVVAKYRAVDEPGKPSVKCKVVAEWQTTQGQRASQLQAVDSGEMFTIVEMGGGPGGNGKVTATLYHWSDSTTPPAGSPVPPTFQAIAAAQSTSSSNVPATAPSYPPATSGRPCLPPSP